jgi:hypothetical protein
MAKAATAAKQAQQRLSDHKFDTSNYIILDIGVRRNTRTGRLVSEKDIPETRKVKK